MTPAYATDILGQTLCLLPERAAYCPTTHSLLLSDVHLGKAETFQAAGVPVAHQVNTDTLARLSSLCRIWQPQKIFILGDLFHSPHSLVPEAIAVWRNFLAQAGAAVTLIVGNHDRQLVAALGSFAMSYREDTLTVGPLLLSHEPVTDHSARLNICGHVHPVVTLRSRLDRMRLPCFYLEAFERRLTLPSFGEFTGGYEITPKPGKVAYVAMATEVIPFGSA